MTFNLDGLEGLDSLIIAGDNQQPSLELGERTCNKCLEVKPLSGFALVYAKSSRGQNYRKHTCIECFRIVHAAQARKSRAANPELYRSHRNKHRTANLELCRKQRTESGQRTKREVFEVYGGAACVCCGETSLDMLNLDHVNNDGNTHRASISGGKRLRSVDMYHWVKRNGYPKGFQVLCYNCNISKHRNGGVCAHLLIEGSEAIPQGSTRQVYGRGSATHPSGMMIWSDPTGDSRLPMDSSGYLF